MAKLVTNEMVDDIPILLNTLQIMNLPAIINEICPTHGNWSGLPIGEMCAIWITHIISQADHRLSHVQKWARCHIHTLSLFLGMEVRELDFTDDRLAIILEKLSDDEVWEQIESRLNQESLRIYDIDNPTVRIDCTTVNSNCLVTEDGLVQFGRSKDRQDLPQIKIALAAIDPIGLPLTISTLPGNRADDPTYTPIIQKVRKSLNKSGLLYVGDSKMSAMSIRTEIVRNGDFYLTPLPKKIMPNTLLIEKIKQFEESDNQLIEVSREYSDGEIRQIAEGFEEWTSQSSVEDDVGFQWEERRIYARSFNYAETQKKALDKRIKKATEETEQMNLRGRGRKPPKTIEEAIEKGKNILNNYSLTGILEIDFKENEERITKRKYKNNPEHEIIKKTINCQVNLNKQAYNDARKTMGWRVYATNKPDSSFSLEKVILAYRNQYIIEDKFHRLKNHPTSLDPMFLTRDDHIDGLIKLASLGLRVLVSIEMKVHESLDKNGESLAGVYEYNPKKITKKPRAERMLKIFESVTLTIMNIEGVNMVFMSELTDLQKRILSLLGTDERIFKKICGNL
ncbi:IS1634 family transposase [Methanoplanus endosymbiosus]|uniref:IS1634 family transposase n=1 Tax=Methanoplanus endosymbiosus TaxID=33865 RepID=A0A9E7PLS1_9EURY|nr:IS1634 family transposase [Methanoplanus endosymbiosus]UUX92494.1 IS1634 family transposase [Methanoplanus endosymbiosus]